MPRFVILEHDHPELHWDFLLEVGPALRAWRLARPPEATEAGIAAQALPDHRPHYLDYEGPVSGGRGTVRRWDAGTFDVEDEADGRLVLRLDGGRVRGRCRLTRDEGEAWRFEREI